MLCTETWILWCTSNDVHGSTSTARLGSGKWLAEKLERYTPLDLWRPIVIDDDSHMRLRILIVPELHH